MSRTYEAGNAHCRICARCFFALLLLSTTTPGQIVRQHPDASNLPLPAPAGPYAIGRHAFDWIDNGRPDQFSSTPEKHRELMIYIWYPAQPSPNRPTRHISLLRMSSTKTLPRKRQHAIYLAALGRRLSQVQFDRVSFAIHRRYRQPQRTRCKPWSPQPRLELRQARRTYVLFLTHSRQKRFLWQR